MRRIFGLLTAAMLGLVVSTALADDKKPDATVKLSAGSVGVGLGVSWGSGTLTYQGRDYPISVNGLSVGDAGVSKVEASGKIYNLKKLEDFDGNYTAAAAEATVGGGAGATTMRNQNGVVADLVATTKGLKLVFGGGGVEMKIKR
jgi:hypothetical protein